MAGRGRLRHTLLLRKARPRAPSPILSLSKDGKGSSLTKARAERQRGNRGSVLNAAAKRLPSGTTCWRQFLSCQTGRCHWKASAGGKKGTVPRDRPPHRLAALQCLRWRQKVNFRPVPSQRFRRAPIPLVQPKRSGPSAGVAWSIRTDRWRGITMRGKMRGRRPVALCVNRLLEQQERHLACPSWMKFKALHRNPQQMRGRGGPEGGKRGVPCGPRR